jgi:hypothetical protein
LQGHRQPFHHLTKKRTNGEKHGVSWPPFLNIVLFFSTITTLNTYPKKYLEGRVLTIGISLDDGTDNFVRLVNSYAPSNNNPADTHRITFWRETIEAFANELFYTSMIVVVDFNFYVIHTWYAPSYRNQECVQHFPLAPDQTAY